MAFVKAINWGRGELLCSRNKSYVWIGFPRTSLAMAHSFIGGLGLKSEENVRDDDDDYYAPHHQTSNFCVQRYMNM